MAMANAHLVAAQERPWLLELNQHQGPLQWEILAERPDIVDGRLALPDKPGLGVELAQNLESRFPFAEGHYAVVVTR